jgi:hypothetical protein
MMEDEDEDMFSNLFVCEEYVVKNYEFLDLKLSLLSSNMSSVILLDDYFCLISI